MESNLQPLIISPPYTGPTETVVELKTASWDRDTFGLFDYEFEQYKLERFRFQRNVTIGRNKHMNKEGMVCWDSREESKDFQNIGEILNIMKVNQVDKDKSKYEVELFKTEEEQLGIQKNPQSMFLVVRSLKKEDGIAQRGYKLNPGDVIKMGRVEYKVTEIKKFDEKTRSTLEIHMADNQNLMMDRKYQDKLFDVTDQVDKEVDTEEENICRYCLQENICEDLIDDLLIRPCKCKGSGQNVHLFCLREWIKRKILSENNNSVITYNWKQLECEVCKTNWPMMIRYKSDIRRLINVEKPDQPYILIEKISKDEENAHKMSAMSLLLGNTSKDIVIGRGGQSDLKLEDISISRMHCKVKFCDNQFVLVDNNSKFGTLIELLGPQRLSFQKEAIQFGRSVFSFALKKVRMAHKPVGFNVEEGLLKKVEQEIIEEKDTPKELIEDVKELKED